MARQVRGRRVMLRVERDQDLGVAGPDRSAGTIRLIDARVRQPDIIQDRLQLSLRNLLTQSAFNFVAQSGRLFHPQSGACTYVKAEQSRIDLGKEILPEERKQPQGEHAKDQETNYENSPVFQRSFQQRFVSAPEIFELALKSALEPAQKRLRCFGAMFMSAHDVHDERRDECSREKVAGKHRKADSFREGHE